MWRLVGKRPLVLQNVHQRFWPFPGILGPCHEIVINSNMY